VVAGFGSRRTLARQKLQKRKRRKRLANRERFDKPAQYAAILDVRVHIFCSRSCALVYSRQLPPGKNKYVEIIVARSKRHKKQSARGGGENKNPEPLHARAHDVKASVEAGVSPAKPPRSRKAATMVDRG
jgi:hypothetical protein